MIIQGKPLLLAVGVLVLLALFGHYLIGYVAELSSSREIIPVEAPAAATPELMPDSKHDTYSDPFRDYFSEHRLEREKERSKQLELLREMINNPNTGEGLREQAQQAWLGLTSLIEKEMTVEKLVIGKGYEDAVLLMNGGIAHLVVRTDALTEAQAVQLIETVAGTLEIEAAQVRVIERP